MLIALRARRTALATQVVRGPSGQIYHSTSIGCLRPHAWPRSWAIHLVENRLFEPFIALVITFNCLELAWESPLDPPGTWKADFIAGSELPLLFIFTFEMCAKILAYGLFMHKHAYLRDSWCCLDFAVVLTAWAPYINPGLGNFTGIRAVRALRPLRTLQYVPGMPLLVSAVIRACSQLGSALAILGFMMIIFGILGQGIFQGYLHYHCATPEQYELYRNAKEQGDAHHRRLISGEQAILHR